MSAGLGPPIPRDADDATRRRRYAAVADRIALLLDGETDAVSMYATVVCELHHAFAAFDWTGFYRVVSPSMLAVGPYQGGHGCLRIPFARGVCGAAARTRVTQWVDDVEARSDHIACSSSTRSEVVVPVIDDDGTLWAVLDVDSDDLAAFHGCDVEALERIAADLGNRLNAASKLDKPAGPDQGSAPEASLRS